MSLKSFLGTHLFWRCCARAVASWRTDDSTNGWNHVLQCWFAMIGTIAMHSGFRKFLIWCCNIDGNKSKPLDDDDAGFEKRVHANPFSSFVHHLFLDQNFRGNWMFLLNQTFKASTIIETIFRASYRSFMSWMIKIRQAVLRCPKYHIHNSGSTCLLFKYKAGANEQLLIQKKKN